MALSKYEFVLRFDGGMVIGETNGMSALRLNADRTLPLITVPWPSAPAPEENLGAFLAYVLINVAFITETLDRLVLALANRPASDDEAMQVVKKELLAGREVSFIGQSRMLGHIRVTIALTETGILLLKDEGRKREGG